MSTESLPMGPRRRRAMPRWAVRLAILVGCVLFILANAHLVYVSFTSQPECVPHLRAGHAGDGYSAARSSC